MGGVSGSATVWLNLKSDSSGFSKGLKDAGKQMSRTGKQMTTKVTLPVLAVGTAVVMTAAKFEKSMNQVRAVTGATGDDFLALQNQAKELGRTTAWSASQAAEGMSFLGMAGLNTTEILATMPTMLSLASAGNLELANAADIATNVMTGYGLTVEELPHAVDVLAKSFTSANVDLEMLGNSFAFAGLSASSVKIPFEETAAAFALMGNAGLQGSRAGTAFRSMINQIAAPTDKAAAAAERLGLEFADAEGNMRPLMDIMGDLRAATAELGGLETKGLVTDMFGIRGGEAPMAILAATNEEFTEMIESVRDAEGHAAGIAEIQLEGFAGAMVKLKSAAEGFAIAIADSGLLEALTAFVMMLTPFVQKLTQADPKLLELGVKIALVAAAVGPALVMIGNLVTAIGTMIPIIGAVGTVLAGPWGIAIALIIAGVALVIANWDSIVAWWQTWGPKLGAQIMEIVQPIVDWWVENWPLIKELFVQVWDGIKEFWATWGPAFMATFKFYWNIIKGVLQSAWNFIKTAIKLAVEIIGGIITFWLKVLTGDWEGAWETLLQTARDVWAILKDWFGEQLEIFVGFWKDTGGTIKELWSAIWSGLLETARAFIGKIGDRLSDFWKFITGGFDDTYEEVEGGSIWPDMWKEMLGTTNWYAQLIEFRIAAMTQYVRDNLTELLDGMVEYNAAFQAVPVGTRENAVWDAFIQQGEDWNALVDKVNAIDVSDQRGRWQKQIGGGYQWVAGDAECGPGG